VQAEEVGEDGGGEVGGEVYEGGPASGFGGYAGSAESFGEPCRGDGAAGE
jgi:hypothetical protein